MEENELKQKVYAISNCEFPLDAFLNDVFKIKTNSFKN